MARIRSIKPEFWTSEQVVECSPIARLLFVGIWNFCDDNGIHPASIKRLKMEIFPSDSMADSEIQSMVDELVGVGLLEFYSVENQGFLRVTGWAKHQRIERPTFKHPLPNSENFADTSPNDRRDFADTSSSPRPRRGVERSGEDRSGEESNGVEFTNPIGLVVPSDAGALPPNAPKLNKKAQPGCPHQEIIELYHEVLPMCPRVKDWTNTRATQLRTRWNEDPSRQNLNYWRNFFGYVAKCDFLVGKAGTGKPFLADLQWITKADNFAKIREGKYENRVPA